MKKQAKKAFLGNFWKILTEKSRFFGARSPFKLIHFGVFRKILGSVTKNGYLKIVQREPFESAGGRIPDGCVLNPLVVRDMNQSGHSFHNSNSLNAIFLLLMLQIIRFTSTEGPAELPQHRWEFVLIEIIDIIFVFSFQLNLINLVQNLRNN